MPPSLQGARSYAKCAAKHFGIATVSKSEDTAQALDRVEGRQLVILKVRVENKYGF